MKTIFSKMLSYLSLPKTKKNKETLEGTKKNSYLKMMHGINRISIIMFLIGIIIVVVKIIK